MDLTAWCDLDLAYLLIFDTHPDLTPDASSSVASAGTAAAAAG